jgi:hypothetical protein
MFPSLVFLGTNASNGFKTAKPIWTVGDLVPFVSTMSFPRGKASALPRNAAVSPFGKGLKTFSRSESFQHF